jgi:ribonuclease HI
MKRRPRTPAPRAAHLFAEPDQSQGAHIANIDGAARGNPGPASYGVIVRRPDGRPLDKLGQYVGRKTNNVAEYYGLIAALDYAHAHRIAKLRVRTDSELIAQQMQGRYKVKSALLRPLHERARKLARELTYFSIEHVPREQNREADALANSVLDRAEPSADRYFSGKRLTAQDLKEEQEYARGPRRIRAQYRKGALYPAEPLDLAEGEEVELILHKLPRP